jgi:hypothetical protein
MPIMQMTVPRPVHILLDGKPLPDILGHVSGSPTEPRPWDELVIALTAGKHIVDKRSIDTSMTMASRRCGLTD